MKTGRSLSLHQVEPQLWCGRFEAMKSPCEIWVEAKDELQARKLIEWGWVETFRIEDKYSRFQTSSYLSYLNQHTEQWVLLDEETEALLNFAQQCWEFTDGWIDVSVGPYFRSWKFDGATPPPRRKQLKAISTFVGWEKIQRQAGKIWLPKGMQLDFGGIGKEYAVDFIATQLALKHSEGGVMVNFGGDLNAVRARKNQQPWRVAIESVGQTSSSTKLIQLQQDAIATSGNTKRFVVDKHGKSLGHILNPKTGWPVAHGPASVSVLGESAMQCGLLATLAMLKGKEAERFLVAEKVSFYCQWRDK